LTKYGEAKNAAPGIEGDRDRVLDRNNPIRAAQSNLSKSIIKQEHQPIRVVSPHNSAQGPGAHDISLRRAVENCRRALTGEAPLHVIGLDERLM